MNKGVNRFQARADGQARLPDNRTHPQQDSRLQQTFSVEGVDRTLRDYRLVTDEELMDGLSFPAYAGCDDDRASSIEMVTIDPQDLQAAQGRDAGAMTNKPVDLDQEGFGPVHVNTKDEARRQVGTSKVRGLSP